MSSEIHHFYQIFLCVSTDQLLSWKLIIIFLPLIYDCFSADLYSPRVFVIIVTEQSRKNAYDNNFFCSSRKCRKKLRKIRTFLVNCILHLIFAEHFQYSLQSSEVHTRDYFVYTKFFLRTTGFCRLKFIISSKS